MSELPLLYEVRDRVAWFTINRPERRNALNGEAIQLFDEYLDRVEADPELRVICVTGVGDHAFCAGADLTSVGGEAGMEAMRNYARVLGRMASFPKPLVARVAGHCLAGGLGVLLSCDVAYAHEDCQFGTPEVGVGLFPMMIGALIGRQAISKKAMEMVYTARRYTAVEAETMGLITRVYARDELDGAIDELLADIASRAPLAVSKGRQALARVSDMDLVPALEFLCEQLYELVQTEDAIEGLTAFLQKRDPVWRGR